MSTVGPIVAKETPVAKFIFADDQSVLRNASVDDLKSSNFTRFRGGEKCNF